MIKLKESEVNARIISFPSWELFEKQSDEYKKTILPGTIRKRVVVETGIKMGWERYAGEDALYITMNRFGASAPYQELAANFGFTVENIVESVLRYLKQ